MEMMVGGRNRERGNTREEMEMMVGGENNEMEHKKRDGDGDSEVETLKWNTKREMEMVRWKQRDGTKGERWNTRRRMEKMRWKHIKERERERERERDDGKDEVKTHKRG